MQGPSMEFIVFWHRNTWRSLGNEPTKIFLSILSASFTTLVFSFTDRSRRSFGEGRVNSVKRHSKRMAPVEFFSI